MFCISICFKGIWGNSDKQIFKNICLCKTGCCSSIQDALLSSSIATNTPKNSVVVIVYLCPMLKDRTGRRAVNTVIESFNRYSAMRTVMSQDHEAVLGVYTVILSRYWKHGGKKWNVIEMCLDITLLVSSMIYNDLWYRVRTRMC